MFLDKDGHQYRVRSMLSDEQQRILKSHYAVNPRPDKFELMQIANQVLMLGMIFNLRVNPLDRY